MEYSMPKWESTGARIFGVSRDGKDSHKAWKQHPGLSYSLLAELTGDVAKKYGAWNEPAHRADRMSVLADPQAIVPYIVRFVVHNNADQKRDQDQTLQAARAMVPATK
jgi:peroxiredoxin